MDVTVYRPNPAIAAALIGEHVQAACLAEAVRAQALWISQVAKRTGRLAASSTVYTEIGGVEQDRHVGVLHIGTGVDYAAAHEFGTGDHPGSIHNLDGDQVVQPGAHDLNWVLEELGGL